MAEEEASEPLVPDSSTTTMGKFTEGHADLHGKSSPRAARGRQVWGGLWL